MSAPPTKSTGLWDHTRAVLVTAHFVAIGLLALPAPGRVTQKTLRDKALKEVFADWRGVLSSIGVDLSKEEAEQLAMTGANAFMDGRDTLLRPMQPYFKYMGTRQSWQMFGYLNRTPAKLKLELYTPGTGWQDLYIARSSEVAWRKQQLDGERYRGMINAYSWKRSRRGFNRFVDWIACEASGDFPEATTFKASMVQLQLPEPATLRELGKLPETGTFWSEVRRLDECVSVDKETL